MEKSSHATVVTGTPLRFTELERQSIQHHAALIHRMCKERPDGWQAATVAYSTHISRTIRGSLNRSHGVSA